MRRIPAGPLLGLVLITLAGFPAGAQQLSQRGGLWAGAGLASALSDVSCNACVEDSKSVISAYLRAGVTLSPRLLLGAELVGTDNSEDGVNERVLGLGAAGYFYPTGGGLFFKGGAGVLKFRADDDTDALTATLLAIQVGTGYEVRLSHRLSLAAFTTLIASANGDLDYNGSRVTDDFNLTLIQFGLGVTFH